MKKLLLLILLIITCSSLSFAQVSEEWISLFNYEENYTDEPTDMAVDADGNIYITGITTVNVRDFITLKYNKLGELLWVSYYDGPNNDNDIPSALALDNAGNVYIVGTSQTQTWSDITIIKYDTDGNQQWIKYYDNNSSDGGYDIAVGENGMIYATGYSNSDMITLQYSSDGELQWVSTYNGTADELDIAFALTLDEQSNVYVTGYSNNTGTYRDYTTIKYNANGEQQWVAIYDGPGHYSDEGEKIARDELNNIYVMGYSNDENGKPQATTVKYDNSGAQLWVNRYFNPETFAGNSRDIAVFNSENIYIAGSIGKGMATVKINSEGDTVWTRQYGRSYGDQTATDIITDADGNIYVTGWIRQDEKYDDRDYGTIKYNPDGDLIWDISYAGPGAGIDDALKICLDAENNVIVTGLTFIPEAYDICTIKYKQSGMGINEQVEKLVFDAYPNPCQDKLRIRNLKSELRNLKFELIDIRGRVVYVVGEMGRRGDGEISVNISHLPAGIYLVKLQMEDAVGVRKLIVQ